MFLKMTALPALLFIGLHSAVSVAASIPPEKVPTCPDRRPELFDEPQMITTVAALPVSVLVARTADVWLESKTTGLKIWARHNFKSGQKSFVCADLPVGAEAHASVPLVVLNDRTKAKKVGDSLWQFQVMAKAGKLGLWNQKSGLMTVTELLDLSKSRWKTEFTQGVLDEHKLRSSQQLGDLEAVSLIRYDLTTP